LGQDIPLADISTLVFRPVADENGSGYDSFTFSVNDGTADSGTYTMTVDVTPVNDAPTAVDDTDSVKVSNIVTDLTNGAGSVISDDTDPDSDPLSVGAISFGGGAPVAVSCWN
jgi:hypothetical protein